MNDYSWSLDESPEFIAHSAHYSKNWKKADQDAYNKTYYQQHKEKWGVKSDASEADQKAVNDFASRERAKAEKYMQTHGIDPSSRGGKAYMAEVESKIESNAKKAVTSSDESSSTTTTKKTTSTTKSTDSKDSTKSSSKKKSSSSKSSSSSSSKKKSSSSSSKKKSSSSSKSKSSSSGSKSSSSKNKNQINQYGSTFQSSKGSSGSSGKSSGGKSSSSSKKSSSSSTKTSSSKSGSTKSSTSTKTAEQKTQEAKIKHQNDVKDFVNRVVKDGAVNLDDIDENTTQSSTKVLVDLVNKYGKDDITVSDLSQINTLLYNRTNRKKKASA